MAAAKHLKYDCEQPASPRLLRGIGEFNAGAYFTCHETLEDLWRKESGPLRELYQGILQIAAALLHLERGHFAGAVSLLSKGSAHLRPFPPLCRQVEVAILLRDSDRLRKTLESLGAGHCKEWNRQLTPRVRIAAESPPDGP